MRLNRWGLPQAPKVSTLQAATEKQQKQAQKRQILHPSSSLQTQDQIKTIDSANGRIHQFSSVAQCVQLFVTPWTIAHQPFLSITNSRGLLRLMPIESVMPSNHLILCHPLLLPPSIFPNISVFSNESVLHIMWPKYWSVTHQSSQ